MAQAVTRSFRITPFLQSPPQVPPHELVPCIAEGLLAGLVEPRCASAAAARAGARPGTQALAAATAVEIRSIVAPVPAH